MVTVAFDESREMEKLMYAVTAAARARSKDGEAQQQMEKGKEQMSNRKTISHQRQANEKKDRVQY